MNELTQDGRRFIGYEYKSVTVERDMANLYMDCFPNFGWTFEEERPTVSWAASVTLKFKRERKMINKMELTRLQRKFENHVKDIGKLEASKTASAAIGSISIGILGMAFMAGSVMSITLLSPISIPLCIVLAAPGFIGCAVPYFFFKCMSAKKTEQITPLIEQEYDAIYETCKNANTLLYN